jgi:hypothetical protein
MLNFFKKLFKGADTAPGTDLKIGEIGAAPEYGENSESLDPPVYCQCLTTFLDGYIRYEAGETCKFSRKDAERFASHGWVSAPINVGDSNG